MYEKHIKNLDLTIQYTDKIIHDIDVKGSFEADDEVGNFFQAVKEMQGHLNQFKLDKNLQDGVQDEAIAK